ncbi:proline-rich receptor-like protein kinase PERK4 [Anopheles merus]|uniref:TUBE n=1 Tax=Anopheles merus TaxID=30066 RepID=A0A0D3QBL7_ANOME|nr:proline-rich receptor-like protein kinase PERK4 [Anopheles merus]AJC98181.1 TUBE [Anopheles merus]
MHRNMEIRHMAFHLETLAHILDTSEGWRDFLYLIPRNLDDLLKEDPYYPLKYTGLNESILETESQKRNLSPSKLLLEEWGISGQVRPTVDHLLKLLVRANQIRAAEYLTTLLKEQPPARPKDGPGAPIDVTLPEDHQTESLLNGISYPSSTILLHHVESITIGNNRDYYDKLGPTKRVEIKDKSSVNVDGELPVFSSSNNNTKSGSDSSDVRNPVMMDRYPDQLPGPSRPSKAAAKAPPAEATPDGPLSSNRLPMISALGIGQPESSKLQNNRNYDCASKEINGPQIPDLSIFGREESERKEVNGPQVPELSIFGRQDSDSKEDNGAPAEHRKDIPALSALLGGSSDAHQTQSNSTNNTHDSIPMLSMLGSDGSTSDTLGSESSSSAIVPQVSESVSDFIKFSSSPVVAVYAYDHLRVVTDGFNVAPYTNGNLAAPNGRSLGAGGFGAVFLALNLAPSIPVAAVKRLDPDKYKFREKFHLELDILSKHSHANVVSLLGSSSDGPRLCLVYEYLKDGNLEAALSLVRAGQRQMGATVRLQYLKDIANAVAFLHERAKIIHRDVKSANILLDGPVAKLCDFGLIKRTSSRTTTSIIGTNAYMAPEAVRGDVSPALDIFAFGIVVAETVTGEPVLAEKESRSEIDLAGYVCRQRAEGRDLGLLVDRRAAVGRDGEARWHDAGRKLLEIAIKCMGEKWSRPNSGALADAIAGIQLVPL